MIDAEHACPACLRRAHLIGHLAPRIADLLRRRSRPVGLLALGEEELIAAVAGTNAPAARSFVERFREDHARQRLREAEIAAVCRHRGAYPRSLLDLSDPPAVLYARGQRTRLRTLADEPVATVVGARRGSPYALDVARGLGRGLAAASVTVVSGLALGVDAAAHRGALDAGDRAVAVLACGVDVPYPRANRPLYRQIAQRGLVVSELPPGVPPLRWTFPARNRIMAALAGISVVVEAQEGSGSLITSTYASDIGRQVGAVPGRVTSSMATGSNRLLREGASVIRGVDDVLDELFGVGGWTPNEDGPAIERPDGLEPELHSVLDAIEAGHGTDAIADATGMPAQAVRASLGRLELMGLVARSGLASYARRFD